MTCATQYSPQLRARGFRMTSQRMAILHVLHHSETHLAPAEVYRRARKDLPGLTGPTVYRTLNFLAQNGIIYSAHSRSGHLSYQIARQDHHHIVCRNCGSEIEVGHALLKKLYQNLEKVSGYSLIERHLSFIGICPKCQARTKGGSR